MHIITRFKDLTIEALKDNKKLIIGLYILFIILFVVAWILSADAISKFVSNMSALNTGFGNPGASEGMSAVEIFVHNQVGGVVTYISSVFFGIPAIAILIYNALNLGMVGQLFASIMPGGGLKYIVYLIPHGIFEITATVLDSAAGLLLFMFIWKFVKAYRSNEINGFSDAFEKTKKILIQSIVLFLFAAILLTVAAPIEAYFSVPFSKLVLGF